ncbi:hypothetical protein Tco_0848663 [Tanacetum coccineum]
MWYVSTPHLSSVSSALNQTKKPLGLSLQSKPSKFHSVHQSEDSVPQVKVKDEGDVSGSFSNRCMWCRVVIE